MKLRSLLLLPLISLTSCKQTTFIEKGVFCFDTYTNIRLYQGDNSNLQYIESILLAYSKFANYYESADINNIYTINHTNEEVEIYKEFYKLLESSFEVRSRGAEYFNPIFGSLSEKWKQSLKNKEVLSEEVIEEELIKINNSSFEFLDDYKVHRIGEAELDLGGIAKGYTLDKIKTYLDNNEITQYLINSGKSSILLGEKPENNGFFTIEISDIKGKFFEAKNCFVSTSGNSEQGVKIGDITYSHIVNPFTGSTIMNYDSVIVISDEGYLGDALSTSMMMNTLDEIKEIETSQNVKTIVIKDGQILYSHSDIVFK